MIRIFASKSFIFKNGEESVSVKNLEMADVPKWVAKTELFKLATADNNIQVIESTKQQKKIENDGEIKDTKQASTKG